MKKLSVMLTAFVVPLLIFAQGPAYKNKKLSPELRAKDLLQRMNLEEKVVQTQCLWIQKSTILDISGDFNEAKAEKAVKNGLGELARLNEDKGPNSYGMHPRQAAILYNKIQHFFVEKTRLGIPVMVHEESLHGQQTQDATNFPVPIALASAWDEGLMTEIYTNVAEEVRARGGQHVLAPVVDVTRDPRWGRTEETMGEDPFLISRLAVAEIKGYQGDGVYLGEHNVATTLKHFGIHGQSEGGLNVSPSNIDERTAREIFFKPFKACVQEAKAMSVMACYNEVFGIPAHINKLLLTDILRKEWGFKGVIVSDYFAVREVSTLHKITPSYDEAGLLAFKAGINIETPDPDGFKNLKQLVSSGKISVGELDETVLKILIMKFRLGLFDHPYVDVDKVEEIVGSAQKRALAYKAAQEAMVLLKNDNQFLPLDKNRIKTIALIGPNADKCLLGGYSSKPRVCISPLQAIRERYGKDIKVLYAEGVRITDKNNWFADTIRLADAEENRKKIREAVEIARQADVVVLFVGGNESVNREGWAYDHLGDMPTLELLNGQNELIKAIAGTGKPTCAFVNSGPPLSIGSLVETVPAVMQCWYLGQEGGYAMADALFGEINPSGKLPISFPRSVGHIPAYYNYKPSARRGYNLGFDVSPLFAFGYGLSYTTFQYSKPVLSAASMQPDGKVTVSADVKNTGERSGVEIVQLYIRDDYSSVTRPVKELKGFKRVLLEPGQTQTVSFNIDREMLSFYDKDMKWVVEPGDFTIMTGGSSDRTESVKLTVTAQTITDAGIPAKGLKDYYSTYFPIGVAVSPQALKRADESTLILQQFNSITPENAMKMGPIHPTENEYYWKDADSIVAFAMRNGIRVRGHCLCWHEQTPAWLFKDANGNTVSKDVLLQRLKDHITTVVSRYRGKVYAWDVVNEVIDDDPGRFLRNSPWYKICGDDFIAKAFEYAHAADPDAVLFYNDYNTERPEKRERVYQLLKKLKEGGVPIGGVGLQAHWSIFEPTREELDSTIRHFSSLNLQVQITELDVSVYKWEKNNRDRLQTDTDIFTPEMEQRQAEKYSMIFDLLRKYKNVITGVTFWNISDRHSWLDDYPVRGRKNYPLLFDRELTPKNAFREVINF